MDFLCEFEGDFEDRFWELLAVTGSLLGVLDVVPGASLQIRPDSVRPSVRTSVRFFFRADSGATKRMTS